MNSPTETDKPAERLTMADPRRVNAPEEKPTDWNELKLAINNAIWMHAPPTTTLAQAEEAACRAISHLGECYTASHTTYAA